MSGSKVPAIMGVSPWDSPLSVWMTMSGRVPFESADTDATRRGTILEPAILHWWRTQHPTFEAWLEYDEQVTMHYEDWGIATLDALALTDDIERVGVEAKSTSKWDGWGKEGTDEIPRYYLYQVWWQFVCVPDMERVYVPVIGPYLDFREYVVERPDDASLARFVADIRAFYESLDSDTPPPLDGHPATLETVSRLRFGIEKDTEVFIEEDLAREYVLAELDLVKAEERARKAKAEVLNVAGKAQRIKVVIPEPEGDTVVEHTRLVASKVQHSSGSQYLKRQLKAWPGLPS